MNTPPFLLAAAALFWGAQTGNWAVATAGAVLLEAPRYVSRRCEFAPADFNRIADFCTVLLIAIAVYLYVTFGNPRAVTLLFQWMPVVVAPLALAQTWSTTRELDLSVLFWSLRRHPMRRPLKLNLAYPHFVLWLVAASAANRQDVSFYLGLALLTAWPLLLARPRSYATPIGATMFLAAALAGYGGQLGLRALQLWVEGAVAEWIAGSGTRTNPYRNTTDIGTIGDLKLSERILLRVRADAAVKTPLLLHRASYDDYVGGTWIARNTQFAQLAPSGPASTWTLHEAREPVFRIMLHDESSGNPVLSLPANAARIDGLAVGEMKMNALGTVQVEHRPGFFSYGALVGNAGAAYGAPTPRDLATPRAEAAAVAAIASELHMDALRPRDALAALTRWFEERFEYSTWQGRYAGEQTPLTRFLLTTRAGHCEYFASATVLLLRAAGIPARYATGFSAHEWSALEGAYVVRERHAHAWTRVWVDGAWQDFDTTPPSWFAAEAARAPFWSAFADLWSWARFRLAAWSAQASERGWSERLAWLALPLCAWFAWRTLRGRRAKTQAATKQARLNGAWPGQDSEFYLVASRLTELGHARREAEALNEWLARIEVQASLDIYGLRQLARLHYRLRFDPLGLTIAEREGLREQTKHWLARHPLAS